MCCVSSNVHGHDLDAKTCNMLTVTVALVAPAQADQLCENEA